MPVYVCCGQTIITLTEFRAHKRIYHPDKKSEDKTGADRPTVSHRRDEPDSESILK